MSDNDLLKQIATDVTIIKTQMGHMREQMDRIERGQKKLAGDIFGHEIEIQGIKERAKMKLVREINT